MIHISLGLRNVSTLCHELNYIQNALQVQTLQPGDALGRHMQPTAGEADFEDLRV